MCHLDLTDIVGDTAIPYLPIYAVDTDLTTLLNWLNDDPEIAFIVSNGPKRWIAQKALATFEHKEYVLWHIPSGSLPLLRAERWYHLGPEPHDWIENPWGGWEERRAGARSSQPYFGSYPNTIRLNVRLQSIYKDPNSIGCTIFQWQGNYYRTIGKPAHPMTEKWWQRLRRWVKKVGVRVPRGGIAASPLVDTYAFPIAYSLLLSGTKGDRS